MSFKEMLEVALKGSKVRKDWWKDDHYIVLKDKGFYDENDNEYFIDVYENKSNWKIYEN